MELSRAKFCCIFLGLQLFIVGCIIYTNFSILVENPQEKFRNYLSIFENRLLGLTNSSKVYEENFVTSNESCPINSSLLLGYQNVNLESEPDSISKIELQNPLVTQGGAFSPPNCLPNNKIAIIIPFRNRDRHLLYFLQYMHPIFQRQQIQYKIYVMNQFGDGTFNKDKLMNVGFVEALKDGFHCYAFHDVDIILTNDKCPYKCLNKPVHLAHSIDKFGGLAYNDYFGGALTMTQDQFQKINGMSNIFWGWGGEDDDILSRIRAAGMTFTRHPKKICDYKMVKHKRDKGNEINKDRFNLLNRVKTRYQIDGLNSLHYKIVQIDSHKLYTNITVDVLASDHN